MTNPNLTLIAEQRSQPGAAVVTLAQFDNDYERVYRSIPIAGVGFARDKSITYDAAGECVGAAYSVTADYVSRKRSAPVGAPVAGFSDLDRSATRE